ncbi:DegV family protein [Ilumatobacter nonamiensis]|uniref:DegV family protein n=1 Tax=Ilumatobacter nonamiensis TaxID=467093 RepID=UPI000349F4EE|nr:DegV family protein [Ilumatobacter nonamiensis]
MIGLVVDSNSQVPPELVERYDIEVVPLTVIVDGVEFLEGVDLDADRFYSAWSEGVAPDVGTSQPSPGAFVDAYARLVERGADEILSVHIAETMSGTLNSARIAAESVDVPVRLVDTRTASFGISCCAWAAAEAIYDGAGLEQAAAVAEQQADGLHTSFVVGVPALLDRSGRVDGIDVEREAVAGIPVLAMTGSDFFVLDTVVDFDAAIAVMVGDALAWPPSGDGLRIAIGTSDESSRPMSEALTAAFDGHPSVSELVQYRIGPSVGAHTGPGTAGLFVF